MAIRASEILLILRAKNQASMTIRRVAKDVQFLGKTIKANQVGAGTMGAGRRASNMGAGMTHLGGAAMVGGGAALLGLGAASKSFADFDTMASQASTQIGNINNSTEDVIANTARLRNEILDMMGEFPATAEEMSDAAFEIFSSADVPFKRGIDLMALFNETAIAGMTDLETATSGAMTILNNFGDPAGPIGKSKDLMNDMFSIIRFGRVDLATLNTMMNQIAPAAAAADQKLSDVGGAIAVLTRRLGPGIASAGLARLFEIFQRRDFQQGMAKAGASITDVNGKLLPLPDIMAQIMRLGPKAGTTLQNFIQSVTAFGSGKAGVQATVQARRALVELVKHYEDYIDIQNRSTLNDNQFNKQLEANLQSAGVRFNKFTNRLRANVLRIGEDAIPTFEALGDRLDGLVDAWEGLDRSTKTTIVALVGSVATFALLGGGILAVAGVVTGLIGLITMLSGFFLNRLGPAIGRVLVTITALGPAARMAGAIMMSSLAGGGLMGRITAMRMGLMGLLGAAKGIAAVGAFVVGMELVHRGPEWASVIGQALLGAGAGGQIGGLPGAVIGAVTLPIIIQIKKDIDEDAFDPSKIDTTGVKELVARRNEIMDDLTGFDSSLPAGDEWWDEQRRQLRMIDKELLDRRSRRTNQLPAGSLSEQVAAGQFKIPALGEDVARGINEQKKVIKKGLFETATSIAEINKITHANLKEDEKKIKDWANRRADAVRQATDEVQGVLDSAVQNLENTYDQFLQANESAMGQLFSGPWLNSETFNLAEEWGITPAIQDLNRDLKEQIKSFNSWQGALKSIGARGAPADLVKMLEGLGPDAVDKLEVLRKASPKMFAQFVSLWKQRQNAVKRETQIDFNAQLAQWNKYGKDIAFEIIAGLRGENTTLRDGFQKYITDNFSGSLSKIKEEVLAEFYRDNPEAKQAIAHAAAVKRAAAKKKAEITERNANTYNIHQRPGETDIAFAKRVAWEVSRRKGKGKPKPASKEKATAPSKAIAPGRQRNRRGGD